MPTTPNPASMPLPVKSKPGRCHVLLQWAAEDLSDASIRSDSLRLEQERQTVIKRLAPYIEEVVQLAFKQLQQDQLSDSSSSSKP